MWRWVIVCVALVACKGRDRKRYETKFPSAPGVMRFFVHGEQLTMSWIDEHGKESPSQALIYVGNDAFATTDGFLVKYDFGAKRIMLEGFGMTQYGRL